MRDLVCGNDDYAVLRIDKGDVAGVDDDAVYLDWDLDGPRDARAAGADRGGTLCPYL